MQRRHSANQSARMYYILQKRYFDVTSQPCLHTILSCKHAPRPIREHLLHLRYFHLSFSRRKIQIRAILQQKESHFISFYSQLSPCAHLAITDTPIKRTAVKSQEKPNYRRLTEINSRYYGLSLMRTLT